MFLDGFETVASKLPIHKLIAFVGKRKASWETISSHMDDFDICKSIIFVLIAIPLPKWVRSFPKSN